MNQITKKNFLQYLIAVAAAASGIIPPTTGIISGKVGIAKMAVLYGSLCIGHQIGAFASFLIKD